MLTLVFVSFPVISVSFNWMMIIQFHDSCVVFIYFVSLFINMAAFPLRCCGCACLLGAAGLSWVVNSCYVSMSAVHVSPSRLSSGTVSSVSQDVSVGIASV